MRRVGLHALASTLVASALAGGALPVAAQTVAAQTSAAQTSAAQTSGAPPGFDPTVCRHVTRHRPAPDVEYIPGVDVRGRVVAPADLPGSPGVAGVDRFEIPLTLDLARRLGLPVPGAAGPAGAAPGSLEVGRLTIDGGRTLFNGRPIGGASEAELHALCRNLR